jgi:hypothetical protein
MAITGNKGEWSEIYAFLRLLADGKLFAADERLNRVEDMFFPIMKIVREETAGACYEYCPNTGAASVDIYFNKERAPAIPASTFKAEANRLFSDINAHGAGKGAFEIVRTESFIRSICVNRLKAPSFDKSDINIQIHDVNTGFEKTVGFSIKSELGSPPTLLNAGRTTNFIYRVAGLDRRNIAAINDIDTPRKLKDRVKAIIDNGGKFIFANMENAVFNNNLIMIDSQMPVVVAEMLIGYYSETANDCVGLADYVSAKDPLSLSGEFYRHKIKEMLCAVALGMKPATKWDGADEASGGYIIVKTNGDVLAYHIYNRDAFRSYLLKNTKFESGGSTRHEYGLLYERDGDIYIKLNLQIRFL